MENSDVEIKETLMSLEELYSGKEISFPTQVESSCFKCGGKGRVVQSFSFSRGSECNLCDGKGKKLVSKIMKVYIPPGADTGYEKTLENVGWPPHTIVLRVKQKLHPYMNRKESNLFVSMQLSLAEALGGFQKVFVTLDGREIIISPPKGSVVSPESVKCIENEGFPVLGNPRQRGKLFVKFQVAFPDLTPETAKLVADIIKEEGDCYPDSDASDADEVELLDL